VQRRYDGAFFPALQIALGNNKFFTGITLSGGAGDTLLQPLVSRSGLLHMLRAAAPSLVELHMPLIPKLSMGGGMPLIPPPQPTLGVQVWSGQHMPKKDFFGKIDTFAEVYLVDQAAGAASVKKGKAEHKTKPVMSNYHPDWHDPQLLGSVEWFTMRVPGPSSNSKLLGLVEDYNTVKSSDLVGHFEAPLPPTGGMKEGWYAVKDEKERDVKGHDKHFAQMYVKAKWMDEQSIQQGIRVPQMPDGKLTSIDLSWRTDLAPNVLQYVLHHAGVLKTLKLAGISCNKDRIYAEQQGSPSEMAVVAQAIHLATHWPGAPLPRGWQQGVHYTLGTSVFRPTQMVVAPGGIFAKVTGRVEGSKDYYIDNGTGQIGSVPAAQLGVISPLCKGWAQSLRVLDVSCNKGWSEQWQDSFGWAVARMSVLEELHMESVPIVTVLRQMQHLSASGCALPPIKVLNVAASHGLRTEEESELLAMVLGGLRDSLGKPGAVLRTTNCFVNLQSFDSALKALAGLGMARDADLELSVPSCNEAQLEQVLAGTSFRGAINTNHMPASIAAAVLRGLAVNTCVSKLNCSSLYHAQPPPLVDQRVRDALRAFLAGNTSIKSLDLSHNPLVPSLPAFLPRWAYRDKQAFSPQLDTEYKYAESPAGNGWHRIRDAIVKQKWELKPHVSQILAEASQHPAWALGALAENKSITKLSLEGCDLGDAGLTSLGQALRANRTLTSLNFDCNRFSLDGLKGFKGCLYGNKKIVVDPPTGEAAMLIGDLQKNISRQEEIVVQSKQQIKIACRGGRVKPWLGNPALKKKALSELVEAKREQGRSSRLMKKIEAEMKWIWDKMDGNARLAVEKQLAKEEAKEEAEYQKELQKQAKMHSKLQGALGALSKFQEKTGKQKKDKGWKKTKDKRHDRDHYDDHHHHYSSDSSWSSFWSSDSDYDYCMENEQFVAADMNANDLAVMHAAEETEAQAEAAAAAEEAADLAEVEAYAGAGPRDLWKGGGGTDGEAARVLAGARARRAARRQACAVRCANAMRHEEAMRERAAWMQNEEDVIHGTVACKYRTAAAFLKALEDAGSQQVTLVTQSSLDRLPRLAAQVVAYGNAPVSVALFVPSLVADESGESGGDAVDGEARMLDSIRQFHAQLAAKGVRKMTISLLFGNSPCEREYDNMYPINNLRNLALDAATTEMVLLVDVDFVPSPQLALVCGGGSRDSKRQPPPAISFADVQSFCCNGAVLVVPAFEVGTESELAVLPSTQDELASLWHERRAEGFHVSNFPKGHSPTDFERWFNASLPYAVTYQENFEPYIIARRVGLPRYDERFRGYGMNKISYLYEVEIECARHNACSYVAHAIRISTFMHLDQTVGVKLTHAVVCMCAAQIAAAGKQFVVLPQVFLTAREHERSHSYERVFGDNRDPGHAVRIALLWGSFKRQVQAKYLTAVTTSDKPAAEEALHKLKPVAPPPPPAYAREPGQDMEERHEDEIAKAKPECKWLFYPSKGRRPVRIAGNKCRKTVTCPRTEPQHCCCSHPMCLPMGVWHR
jgi:hypothetical protein